MPTRVRTSLLLLLVAAPTAAFGQKAPRPPKPPPVLRGAVQDTLGQPLEGAQVEILGSNRTITTPASGVYRVEEIKPGRYWVMVRRIGYAPLRTALSFEPGDDRQIIFQLEPLPQSLPDIEVRAEDARWAQRFQEFLWRSKSSLGHFLTRDDIQRSRPVELSDVVRRYLPFTSWEAFYDPYAPEAWGSPRYGSFMTAGRGGAPGSAAGGCPPSVSVNGARPMGGWAVNDFRPEDVEAIEVYRKSYQLPMEFSGWSVGCGGLVVVWLR